MKNTFSRRHSLIFLSLIVVFSFFLINEYLRYKQDIKLHQSTVQLANIRKFTSKYVKEGVYLNCNGKSENISNCNYFNLSSTDQRTITINGQAYWQGSNKGQTNSGSIDGSLSIINENEATYSNNGCLINFKFENDTAVLLEDTNSSCGGINVTFNGIYKYRTDATKTKKSIIVDNSWLNYVNNKYSFQLKYPNNPKLHIKEVDMTANRLDYEEKCRTHVYQGCGGSAWPDYKVYFLRENGKSAFDINIWENQYPLLGVVNDKITYSISSFKLQGEWIVSESIEQDMLNTITSSIKFDK